MPIISVESYFCGVVLPLIFWTNNIIEMVGISSRHLLWCAFVWFYLSPEVILSNKIWVWDAQLSEEGGPFGEPGLNLREGVGELWMWTIEFFSTVVPYAILLSPSGVQLLPLFTVRCWSAWLFSFMHCHPFLSPFPFFSLSNSGAARDAIASVNLVPSLLS